MESFTLESGLVLTNVRVAFRTWGTLSAAAVNCLFVAHSLTDNAAIDTWWAAMLGDGRAFDTSRYFVLCEHARLLLWHDAGPLDTVPEATPWVAPRDGVTPAARGRRGRYAGDFPHTTIRDTVRLHQLLLVHECASSTQSSVPRLAACRHSSGPSCTRRSCGARS